MPKPPTLRFTLVALMSLLIAVPASADIWGRDVRRALAEAKRTRKPLMFYVLGGSSQRDDDVEDAQQESFRDRRVQWMAEKYVAVRMSRSVYRDQLRGWGLPERINMAVVFATPDGDLIGTVGPSVVAEPHNFAQKMSLVYRQYRRRFYSETLAEKITGSDTDQSDLLTALGFVTQFTIISADQDVIGLLDRDKLSRRLRRAVYVTLAELSTPAAVETLMDKALAGDKDAAKALTACTPDAAERMLTYLDASDVEQVKLVYGIVTDIARDKKAKPARFFDGPIERLKREELKRVEDRVRTVAQRWREVYGQYR